MTAPAGSDDGRGDDLDDPALHSMRAVWISMRDEEPPSSGLAELLAAARTKAEAMRPKEPWWRRALVAMRRPPVLALASVVVLLGGAVWIAGQSGGIKSMPSIDAAEPAVRSEPVARDQPMSGAGGEAFESAPAVEPAKEKLDAAQPRIRRKPVKAATPPPPPPATAPTLVEEGASVEETQKLQMADDSGAPAQAPRVSATSRGPAPQLELLAKQSETAAVRGDCPAVRALADRIRALDATYHKDHVERHAAVKRCMASR